MIYKKSISSQMFVDGTEVTYASHKGVEIEFIVDADSLLVIDIYSSNKGKGEAQEALALLKADFLGKKYRATVPLNAVAEHLFEKSGFEYPKDEI